MDLLFPLRRFLAAAPRSSTCCLILLTLFNACHALLHTAPPLGVNLPFQFMWNAPTELCRSRFGLRLPLEHFQFVSSTLKASTNQSITLFYIDRFGVFPYMDKDTGKSYNGGIPQLIDFKEHLRLAKLNISFYIPSDHPGFTVLDFEEWRPQWARNWGSKSIYKRHSIDLVIQSDLSLNLVKAEEKAKKDFEEAAKAYFRESLKLGKSLKPNRLWGYYLFPDCYNYEYRDVLWNYTGRCPKIEQDRNNQLLWLWQESEALYPSIYLELILKDSPKATMYVRHRIQESMRVSMLPNKNYSIPIYAYIRPVYKDTLSVYLSEYDLVNTIGEAAALGSAGAIAWGDLNVSVSAFSCSAAKQYLVNTMNPYMLNVSTAARFCSTALCGDNGRCLRKNWNSSDYLHLDPSRHSIERYNDGSLSVKGQLSQEDIDWFEDRFTCMCYTEEPCESTLVLNTIPERLYNRGVVFAPSVEILTFLLCVVLLGHYRS
ncbi:hyaluronidase PH-20 isoform X2 [Amia ocellicauda]